MIRNFIIIISVLGIFTSCEKINIGTSDSNLPVVECYISPGNPITAKVYKQIEFSKLDSEYENIDSLNIVITDGIKSSTMKYVGKGIYTDTSIKVTEDKEYYLKFEYNDKIVSSQTSIPLKPLNFASSSSTMTVFSFSQSEPGTMPTRPTPVELTWDNENYEYHMIVIENIENNPVLINEINEDDDRPRPVFRNEPTTNASEELMFQNFSYYGTHRVILFKLNAEYAALYERLSNNSLNVTEPPTNVENGLGIFTGINSDTLYIEVTD